MARGSTRWLRLYTARSAKRSCSVKRGCVVPRSLSGTQQNARKRLPNTKRPKLKSAFFIMLLPGGRPSRSDMRVLVARPIEVHQVTVIDEPGGGEDRGKPMRVRRRGRGSGLFVQDRTVIVKLSARSPRSSTAPFAMALGFSPKRSRCMPSC